MSPKTPTCSDCGTLNCYRREKTFPGFCLKVLAAKGLESYTVLCKVGSVDKCEVGIAEDMKIQQGCHESLCNPILQARTLNRQKTGLNVIVGLCVGHDSLFMRHSKAPVTTLITKDRVLAHNPAAALYTCGFYYKRLLDPSDDLSGRPGSGGTSKA